MLYESSDTRTLWEEFKVRGSVPLNVRKAEAMHWLTGVINNCEGHKKICRSISRQAREFRKRLQDAFNELKKLPPDKLKKLKENSMYSGAINKKINEIWQKFLNKLRNAVIAGEELRKILEQAKAFGSRLDFSIAFASIDKLLIVITNISRTRALPSYEIQDYNFKKIRQYINDVEARLGRFFDELAKEIENLENLLKSAVAELNSLESKPQALAKYTKLTRDSLTLSRSIDQFIETYYRPIAV